MIRMIVFDYGRTLYDRETDQLFPDAVFVVKQLSRKYKLSIVSYSTKENEAERIDVLKINGILRCFDVIRFTNDVDKKSQEYNNILQEFNLKAHEVAVVDDYVIRGIAWGNQAGATTVWYQNGKFANVMPDEKTGQPNFIIHSLSELTDIFT